ncbi:MAG: right-handed parallel beta-helix repeat-containing protein [Actinomycetota bacterium]
MKIARIVLLCALVVVGLTTSTAKGGTEVTPACGDTLGPGGVFILEIDLLGCATDPALTLDGATLDMDGHSVTGDGSSGFNCIELTGAGSVLANGKVAECEDGVAVAGSGGHKVFDLAAEDNNDDGIDLDSNANIVFRITSSSNDNDGFTVDGDDNLLFGNTAIANGEDDAGFGVAGITNRFWKNTAKGQANGYRLDPTSTANILVANSSKNAGEDGFSVGGDNNFLFENTAATAGDSGIEILGLDASIGGNIVKKNGDGVVVTAAAAGNRVLGNTSKDNTGTDLVTDNAACSANDWEGNKYGTRNDDCVDPSVTAVAAPSDLDCGDTITGGNVFLTKSIGPCSVYPALTLTGGARLDLKKRSVKGDGDGGPCIQLDDAGATLARGTVSGCESGVTVAGTGQHYVRGVKMKGNGDYGIRVESDNNEIFGVKASKNPLGVDVIGDSNDLWRNKSTKDNKGFVVDSSSISGVYAKNTAVRSKSSGFEIRGDSNAFLVNKAVDHKEQGFDVTPVGNENGVLGNQARDNRDDGILIAGSDNVAVGNKALGNKIDLHDVDVACVSNLWYGNKFKKRDPLCIT